MLVGDDLATAPRFAELCKANVERAQQGQNQNREGDDLCAGIDLADQFARELPQKYLPRINADARGFRLVVLVRIRVCPRSSAA